MAKTVTVLGINGNVGHQAALAFKAAGWRVTGFGRTNKQPIAGVEFVGGDANNLADLQSAVGDSEVVFNGLNLPYDKWFGGAAEALNERVIAAASGKGRTLLFPGNIYNYSASDRVITPELRQTPQTERGAIRVRMENQLAQAAAEGELCVIILRAGDFFGPGQRYGWFSEMILREADKNRIALNADRDLRHAWAYLPDLARAFVALAEDRAAFGDFETFHFAGHFVSANELHAAIEKAAGRKLTAVNTPWGLLRLAGLVMPVMREIVKMRYLNDNEMALADDRLDAILGEDFGTPLDEAVASTVAPFFADQKAAA